VEYRNLGSTGPKVSEIGLGGDTFGETIDEQATRAIIDRALDLGINFIDTADVYGGQRSEVFVGKAIKGKRSRVILATKFGVVIGKGSSLFETPEGLGSRDYIMKAVDASLKRLDTDYIDLYQFHMPDPITPIEETLRALNDLVSAGKVRYIGCSNFTAWELCEALWISNVAKLKSFVSIQSRFSLMDRHVEEEIIPCCQAYNIGVIPWFPLAGGFLTGKYRRGTPPPPGTRFGANPAFYTNFLSDTGFDLLEKYATFASERGHTMTELAFAWLLAHPSVSTVIAGVTKIEQVLSNVAAAAWKLTDAEMAQLDKATNYRRYSMRPTMTRHWGNS
jgi:aryl-alcohol dehydrogenase-like predicted oxidoreductase